MGHSLQSVKHAVMFAVFVAVLVTVHDRVTAGMVTRADALEAPAVQHAVEAGEEAFACLWRGCPILSHPLLRASAPTAGQRSRAPRGARAGMRGATNLAS
jgi:hypothetical protein